MQRHLLRIILQRQHYQITRRNILQTWGSQLLETFYLLLHIPKLLSTQRSSTVISDQVFTSSHVVSSTTVHSQLADLLTKLPPIKPPHATASMTNQQCCKFKIDWGMFKSITTIPPTQVAVQLYNLCNEPVQNSIINMSPNFLTLNETDMIHIIQSVVTSCSNPSLNHMTFSNLTQS